jgi:glyoxylase-like metal-dependent hydrolase (beta-lactamase superfamily II)
MTEAFGRAGLTVFERGWLSSNNVLFDAGGAEPVLVDTGYASHAEQTVALVRHALGGRRLARVVNTHLHSDHCGGNHALQQAFACTIDVPGGEVDAVDAWDEEALTFRATGQHCPRFARSGTLAAGGAVRLGRLDWQVIGSPGHDPHSVVLHQPELALLISADALWENGFGLVFPALEGLDGFDDVRATLDRLAELRVRSVIPGHGRPFEGFEPALERAHRRLDGFVADPLRHARHAAKVLIKFHLMELQRQTLEDLGVWIEATPLLRDVHRHFGGATSRRDWWMALVGELAASGALRLDGEHVANG